MPLHVRRLPGRAHKFIDDKALLEKSTVCYNPSRAGPYTYVRATVHSKIDEVNHVILFDGEELVFNKNMGRRLQPTLNLFQGIEDLRLAMHGERLWFTATCTHASESMNNEMLLGVFTEDVRDIEHMEVIDVGPLPAKNVCPFVKDDALHLLDLYRSKIYRVDDSEDPDRGSRWKLTPVQELRWHAGEPGVYRGSTSPIHLHGSIWGCVGHDIIFNDSRLLKTRLAYLHHWIEFDIERGVVTFVSGPFWIRHWGVEYVSGIHKEGDSGIKLYLGVMDRMALIFNTTLADLRCGKM